LTIHGIRQVAQGQGQNAQNPDYMDLYYRFGYSLYGRAKDWFADRHTADGNAGAITEQRYNAMLNAFKSEFSPYGPTRIDKSAAWEALRWDPENENVDIFSRKIRELGNELGKNHEDMINAFVKAMPMNVIPSIASLNDLCEMVNCVKRLIGFFKLNEENSNGTNRYKILQQINDKVDKLSERVSLIEDEIHLVRTILETSYSEESKYREMDGRSNRSRNILRNSRSSRERSPIFQNHRDRSPDRYNRMRSPSNRHLKDHSYSKSNDQHEKAASLLLDCMRDMYKRKNEGKRYGHDDHEYRLCLKRKRKERIPSDMESRYDSGNESLN